MGLFWLKRKRDGDGRAPEARAIGLQEASDRALMLSKNGQVIGVIAQRSAPAVSQHNGAGGRIDLTGNPLTDHAISVWEPTIGFAVRPITDASQANVTAAYKDGRRVK